ncbi:porin family protein [Anditalea andensis]|uniref:Outer membrane protein beta-barrel domain-containing protein n=1 Tax=Anditalea andensis TaxID=1048983 RepID=A0A074KV25_9BACT|nr:porin family protein [Anditalea andensis]KEO72759.1 hypothetical protein EL17_14070 [Anditalea andensis]
MQKLFIISIFLIFTNMAYGQQVEFGVRVGPSFTTLGGEGSDGSEFGIWFHLGGYLSVPISETISFEPGLIYARKGAKGHEMGTNLSIRNDYIDIPLVLKAALSESFFVVFGPQPSFLVGSSIVMDSGGNRVTVDGSDIRSLYRNLDFAGILGLGVNLPLGLGIQATYEHGLVTLMENESAYNRGIKFSLNKRF